MTTKTWRILFFVTLGILVLVGGILIARAIQNGQIEKEISFTVLVSPSGDYAVAMTPVNPETGEPELSLKKGETGTFTITNTTSGGFDAQIEYTVTGLPEGTFSFSINPVDPGQTTILTIDATNLISNTAYVCVLSARSI